MNPKYKLAAGALAAAFITGACSAPAPTANSNTATKPAASPAAKTSAKTPPKTSATEPKTSAAKKEIPPSAKAEVPKDWETYYDETKGYEFKLPKDSKVEDNSVAGYDNYYFKTPGDIDVYLVVYNDKTRTKEDLFQNAIDFSKEDGDKDFTLSNKKELNDDYSIADYTYTDKSGKKRKGKVLVAVDKSDNYIFFVDSEDAKYDANSKTIDEIWSSFSMYSGGASGDSAGAKKTEEEKK